MTIPTEIEKDIKSGKARYQTFQTGIGGQSVLKVTPNSYIIIFGYDFSPAGGGIVTQAGPEGAGGTTLTDPRLRPFETQQIGFYTGQAFHPFVHHVNAVSNPIVNTTDGSPESTLATFRPTYEIDNSPIKRSVYIISGSNVAIAVGLLGILDEEGAGINFGPIGITNNTPQAVTYGGDGNNHAVQSFLDSATGSIFTQPSVEDVDFYSTGFAPQPNAEAQVYVKPRLNSVATQVGLIDPSDYINTTFGNSAARQYASHYFLNVHYALYTNQTPEQLG